MEKHFPEAEVTVENHGRLDILDRQDGYDRRNDCDIVHGVALLFLAMNANPSGRRARETKRARRQFRTTPSRMRCIVAPAVASKLSSSAIAAFTRGDRLCTGWAVFNASKE